MKRFGIEAENMSEFRAMAVEIYSFCVLHGLWQDVVIYFDEGTAWSTQAIWGGVEGELIAPGLYEYNDRQASKYIPYVNKKTLSMSFEGPLYDVLNGMLDWPDYASLSDELSRIFERYGYYAEFGDSWNLTLFDING